MRGKVGLSVKNLFSIANTAINSIAVTDTCGHFIPGPQPGKQNKIDINGQNDDKGDGQQEPVPLHSCH